LKNDFKIIDLHCDTILRLMENRDKLFLKKNNFSIDIEKLKKANSMAQFFAMFVGLKETSDPLQTCLDMIDKFYEELDRNKDEIEIAKNYNDIINNIANNKISAFLTIEEGGVLKGKIENLRNFYRLGVRLITLTWNYENEIGYPNCKPEYMEKGLTEFGGDIVSEMNRLGMIIDVSHLSDRGFYDVARLSTKPFTASHSNSRSIRDHKRNLTDDMIRILADKGGITGINFEKSFLSDKDISTVQDMAEHIMHIRNVGGIDVISLGTDFDGISPENEVQNIGEIYKLIEALKKNKLSDDEIDKICSKNALRVIRDVMK
jgi:membrane dipeptidase